MRACVRCASMCACISVGVETRSTSGVCEYVCVVFWGDIEETKPFVVAKVNQMKARWLGEGWGFSDAQTCKKERMRRAPLLCWWCNELL